MNKSLLDALTEAILGMGLTEDDVLPLGELADCLVELDLDRDGGEVDHGTHGTHGRGREGRECDA